jgi:hypothetical protein
MSDYLHQTPEYFKELDEKAKKAKEDKEQENEGKA